MQMRISQTPLSGEDGFHEETKAFLALLRSIPPVPEEDDPNGWFHQIRDHLKRSPRERLARWAWFCGDALRRSSARYGVPHVRFDPVRVLRTLSDHEVVFVMVGMGAGYLQGAPYPSYNTDITPRMDRGNIARLERVLAIVGGAAVGDRRVGACHRAHSAGVPEVDDFGGDGQHRRCPPRGWWLRADNGSRRFASKWLMACRWRWRPLEDVICSKQAGGCVDRGRTALQSHG